MQKKSALSPFQPTMGPIAFLVWGIGLMGLKFNLNRFVFNLNIQHELPWLGPMPDFSKVGERGLFLSMLAISLPFIMVGLALTIKRLRDAALPFWWTVLFFVPFLNLAFFVFLSIYPSRAQHESATSLKHPMLDRIIPRSSAQCAAFGFLVGSCVSLALGIFLIYGAGHYGWTLFVGVPFINGLIASLAYGYHEKRSMGQYARVAMLSSAITGVCTLTLAIEGVLCLVMAAPLALGISAMGGALAYLIQAEGRLSARNGLLFFFLLPVVDTVDSQRELPGSKVVTQVEIAAPAEVVWENLIEFPKLAEPEELMFRAGISYPTHAVIEGRGVGAVRYCNFSTGSFVEPIHVWDHPRRLAFSVTQQPAPMQELSPYGNIDAPHLHGYFVSERGEFLLIPTEKGTLLVGTTWYNQKLWPAQYWEPWIQYIIHKVHLRVLHHIRDQAEAAQQTSTD